MCFRRFKAEGLENIPKGVPVIVVANHTNTLMDPLVILYTFPGLIGFGARADIFRKPKVAGFLRWLRILPLARERDGREAVASHRGIMEEITECIGKGVAFGLFPEGTHYPDNMLHPFKKGAARMACAAADQLGRDVYIVPVGISYSSFFHFMSDVEIRYGKVLCVSPGSTDLVGISGILYEKVAGLTRHSCTEEDALPKEEACKLPFVCRLAIGLSCLPFYLASAVIASPLLIAEALIKRKLDDMAWVSTACFACSFLFFMLWPFHSLFHLLNNYYKTISNVQESARCHSSDAP